jgi:hypothetical protein
MNFYVMTASHLLHGEKHGERVRGIETCLGSLSGYVEHQLIGQSLHHADIIIYIGSYFSF